MARPTAPRLRARRWSDLAEGGRRLFRREVARDLKDAVGEHGLTTYAAALAFQALLALIPLTLLGLGLLAALDLSDVWTDTLAPAIEPHVTRPVYEAIDFSVAKVFATETTGLVAFAFALVMWYLTLAVRVIMEALNRIHDVEDHRPLRRRLATMLWLALALGISIVGAALTVTVPPRLVDGGALDVLLGLVRWPAAVALLGLAVALLMRYAPAERPEKRWASAGSLLVVAVWIGASLAFAWWVNSVANFKTAVGNLAVFLALTAYVFTTAAIFILGAELDEIVRKEGKAASGR